VVALVKAWLGVRVRTKSVKTGLFGVRDEKRRLVYCVVMTCVYFYKGFRDRWLSCNAYIGKTVSNYSIIIEYDLNGDGNACLISIISFQVTEDVRCDMKHRWPSG